MELEQEAQALGWVPLERFRGDPEKWSDAATFVQRGKDIMPILKANNAKLVGTVDDLTGKVGKLESALAEANESMKEFRLYHDETAKRSYEAALRDLKAQKVEAVKEADGERVVEIDDAITELNSRAPKPLKQETVAPPTQTPPTVHPDYKAWETDNPWLADKEKQAYAASIAGYIRAMHGDLQGRAFLDKVTEEVGNRFDLGTAPSPNKVEGGRPSGRTGGRTYNDLPAEAKQACDRLAAKFVGDNKTYKTAADWRKSYVSNYDWS